MKTKITRDDQVKLSNHEAMRLNDEMAALATRMRHEGKWPTYDKEMAALWSAYREVTT
jgi:hypothetical protein